MTPTKLSLAFRALAMAAGDVSKAKGYAKAERISARTWHKAIELYRAIRPVCSCAKAQRDRAEGLEVATMLNNPRCCAHCGQALAGGAQ